MISSQNYAHRVKPPAAAKKREPSDTVSAPPDPVGSHLGGLVLKSQNGVLDGFVVTADT